MRAQTEAAIAAADAVLFLIDARSGLTPTDRAFADVVRRAARPVIVLANKSEGRKGGDGALEAYELGLGTPLPISAEHGEGLSDLYDALLKRCRRPPRRRGGRNGAGIDRGRRSARPIKVAVIGRPNVGKSTLINALLGEDRLLTGPEAGITRDAIAVDLVRGGRAFQVWDTAGLRRRARIDDKLEKLSVADALRAVRFAEVVVVLMDATKPFEEQDTPHRRSGGARGQGGGDRFHQMGSQGRNRPAPSPVCARRPISRCRRSAACRSSRSRLCRPGPRPAAGGGGLRPMRSGTGGWRRLESIAGSTACWSSIRRRR